MLLDLGLGLIGFRVENCELILKGFQFLIHAPPCTICVCSWFRDGVALEPQEADQRTPGALFGFRSAGAALAEGAQSSPRCLSPGALPSSLLSLTRPLPPSHTLPHIPPSSTSLAGAQKP